MPSQLHIQRCRCAFQCYIRFMCCVLYWVFTLSLTIINDNTRIKQLVSNSKYFALQGSRRRRRVQWSSFVHVARLKIGRMMGQDFLLKLFLNKHFLNSVGAWAYVGYKPWWIRKQQTFLGVPHNLTPCSHPTRDKESNTFNVQYLVTTKYF